MLLTVLSLVVATGSGLGVQQQDEPFPPYISWASGVVSPNETFQLSGSNFDVGCSVILTSLSPPRQHYTLRPALPPTGDSLMATLPPDAPHALYSIQVASSAGLKSNVYVLQTTPAPPCPQYVCLAVSKAERRRTPNFLISPLSTPSEHTTIAVLAGCPPASFLCWRYACACPANAD